MPKIPGFIETLNTMKDLHIKKNDDYANDANPFYNFDKTVEILKEFTDDRDKVFVWPIANKLMRLANLLSSSKEPNNEAIADSLDDIAVYTIIWKCDMERRGR